MNRRVIGGLCLSAAWALTLMSCGGGGSNPSPSPSAPSPSNPTLTAVSVGGPGSAGNPGQSAQFTATATLSNGTTQNVTNQASWQSSNNSVATVSGSGMVTAVAPGETDIRATYQSLTGSARVSVSAPAPPRLSGRITDQSNDAALADVRVEVKDRGMSTTSDGDGRYLFSSLAAGQYTLRASKSGYELAEPGVSVAGSTTFDFSMRRQSTPAPTPPAPPPAPTPPAPTPPAPTPPPGGTCPASSIPANAVCIGNGTPPVTAVCNDGAFSCSQNRQGTCSSHNGVRCWVCPGVLCSGLTSPGVTAPVWLEPPFTPVPWSRRRVQ
jgi:Carboxypeptidase regulatory-like domain/Bacterial Ig-like domain (group 2)/Protein of unknown function (DUF3761)